MSLAEVAALEPDGASSSLSLFVHCRRDAQSLQLQLLDETTLLEAQVLPRDKPRALDCSAAEYVAAVETALSPVGKNEAAARFEFRWSRSSHTLTLMERAGFAMKFASIKFHRSEEKKLPTLLHLVAQQQRENREIIREKEEKIISFDRLLKQKETLLEAALTQKQKREDALFQGFCAVLNAKKDEIKRLQNELERAQEVGRYEMKMGAKKKMPAGKRPRKGTGAKLKKVEDEDMSDGSKESDDDSTVMEGEEDEIEKKRSKRDAISAYSHMPSLRSSSVQISSAEDLLSSMDDIIKNEEETDEAVLRGTSSPKVKSEPAAAQLRERTAESAKPRSSSRTKMAAPVKKKASPPPKLEREPVKLPRPAAPTDEPMDSEEEDILDMLS